jgi:KDO2-lipid IV(A) lauroyltransferase
MGLNVHFVGREPYDQRLWRLYKSVRASHGGAWISRGGAFQRLCEVLDRGETAIMLIDQDTARVKGTFVDFFGRKAWTPTGPAVLARLTGSALIPCTLVREKKHRYSIIIKPPVVTVETGSADYDDWENTRRASLAMESLVSRYPDQWAWFHRRWRTRPPESWQDPVRPVDGAEVNEFSRGGDG